jgi:hypothetical protein
MRVWIPPRPNGKVDQLDRSYLGIGLDVPYIAADTTSKSGFLTFIRRFLSDIDIEFPPSYPTSVLFPTYKPGFVSYMKRFLGDV